MLFSSLFIAFYLFIFKISFNSFTKSVNYNLNISESSIVLTAVAFSTGGSLLATDLPELCTYIGDNLQSANCVQFATPGNLVVGHFTVTRGKVVIDATDITE